MNARRSVEFDIEDAQKEVQKAKEVLDKLALINSSWIQT
jgi:hypothetical protein